MKIDKQEIYSIPIIEVAERLGITIQGKRGRCFNPSGHRNGDKHPSLIFGNKQNVWKCPICNFNFKYPTPSGYGSVIDLVMLYLNIDYKACLKWFSDNFNVSTEKFSSPLTQVAHTRRSNGKGTLIRGGMENVKTGENQTLVYEYFLELLGNISNRGRTYLKNRRLSDYIINAYRITDIKDYQETSNKLKSKFDMGKLKQSGLFNKEGNLIFYKHPLLFPFIKDYSIVFIQGRSFDNTEPKYLNTGSVIEYPYNSNMILDNPDITGETVYITEGVIDCLSLMELQYNAIGIIGFNNFKREWVKWFKDVNVCLAFDNEGSGELEKSIRKGVKNIVRMFENENLQKIKFITPADINKKYHDCKDWNDVLIKSLK